MSIQLTVISCGNPDWGESFARGRVSIGQYTSSEKFENVLRLLLKFTILEIKKPLGMFFELEISEGEWERLKKTFIQGRPSS